MSIETLSARCSPPMLLSFWGLFTHTSLFLVKWLIFWIFLKMLFGCKTLAICTYASHIKGSAQKCQPNNGSRKIPTLNHCLIGGCFCQILLNFGPSSKVKSKYIVIFIVDESVMNSGRAGVKYLSLLPACNVTILP